MRPQVAHDAGVRTGDIKDLIRQRARERQRKLQRGEIEIPLQYPPLRLTTLKDLVGQLEYRTDFLSLAVLPEAGSSLLGRLKQRLKSMFRLGLRWLLIRQVEFNTVVRKHAAETHRQLDLLDQHGAQVHAVLSALKLQIHTLARRVAELEGQRPPVAQPSDVDADEVLRAAGFAESLLTYLRESSPALVLGCGRGDLVRLLLAEGAEVQGVESDPEAVAYCQERELPVVQDACRAYLERVADGSLAALCVGRLPDGQTLEETAELFALCWRKLQAGGTLVVVAENASCRLARVRRRAPGGPHKQPMPVEVLTYLLENRCFTLVDCIHGLPLEGPAEAVVHWGDSSLLDLQLYRSYALVGRK